MALVNEETYELPAQTFKPERFLRCARRLERLQTRLNDERRPPLPEVIKSLQVEAAARQDRCAQWTKFVPNALKLAKEALGAVDPDSDMARKLLREIATYEQWV